MNLNKAASRYGKALLSFAIEQNQLETVKKDIDVWLKLLNDSREFRAFVDSQVIQEEKKVVIYKKLFEGMISELTLKFFILVAKNHRSTIIPFICEAFVREYKDYKKIFTIQVTSAVPLDEKIKDEMVKLLLTGEANEIEIIEKVDPSLIGGFILRTTDAQLDASVATKLAELKRDLHHSAYTSKI